MCPMGSIVQLLGRSGEGLQPRLSTHTDSGNGYRANILRERWRDPGVTLNRVSSMRYVRGLEDAVYILCMREVPHSFGSWSLFTFSFYIFDQKDEQFKIIGKI